ARLCMALGRFPTVAELADALGVDPAVCGRVLQALEIPVSLNAPAGQDGAPLSEAVPDPGAWNPETLALEAISRENPHRLLGGLPAHQAEALGVLERGREISDVVVEFQILQYALTSFLREGTMPLRGRGL